MARIPPRDVVVYPSEIILPKEKKGGVEKLAEISVGVLQFTTAPKGFTVTVGTTPTRILVPPHERPYVFVNPSAVIVPGTSSYLIFSGTVSSSGNTQTSPIAVSGILKAHLFLRVTAITGVWDIYAQALDPITNTWFDTQVLWGGVNATGNYYTTPGELGIVTDFAIRWVPTTAGSMTFSVSMSVKQGIAETSSGVSRDVYIGGPDVNVGTGYRIPAGSEKVLAFVHDVTVYAVSLIDTPLTIFRT